MPAPNDVELLVRALALSSLIGAALEYSMLIRHRVARRANRVAEETQQAALRGLVRVMLVDR